MWIHAFSTKIASNHLNEKREGRAERWIRLLVRCIRFGMEGLKALQSLGQEGMSSKVDASFGLCLLHPFKYPVFSFFSEMEAPTVVCLAVQTSVAGVKR